MRDDYEPRMVSMSAEEPAPQPSGQVSLSEEFRLGPRNPAELVDLGVEVLTRRFLPCVGISVLLWLPIRALMPVLLRMVPQTGFDDEKMMKFWAAMGGYSLVAKFIEILVTMSVTLISYEALVGRELAPMAALGRTLQRTLALIGLFLLQFLIIMVGAWILLALGIMCPPLMLGALGYWLYFSWKLWIAPSILMLEDLGVGATVSRSFRLTEGSFLRWLGVLALTTVLSSGLAGGMQISDNQLIRDQIFASTSISPVLFDVIFVLISSVFAGLSTAILAVTATTFYLDTRIRREGLDLRMRLERRLRSVATEPAT